MAPSTLQLARDVMQALSERDRPRLTALADPDVEWRSFFAELGEGGAYHGHEGMEHYIDDLSDAFEIVRAEVDDGVAVGDVAVLVGRIHYRGKGSGIENEMPAGWMLKFRDGRVIRFRAFREPGRALEAIALGD